MEEWMEQRGDYTIRVGKSYTQKDLNGDPMTCYVVANEVTGVRESESLDIETAIRACVGLDEVWQKRKVVMSKLDLKGK